MISPTERADPTRTAVANPLRFRGTSLALLLILLLAAFLRFWQLDSLPPGLYHDEAYYGLDALSLLDGATFPIFYEGWELYAQDAHATRPPTPTRFPIFFEGNYGREPLHVYLVALSIKLWGPTPFAIRFVPATAGVLAVFTTYLAAVALLAGKWRSPVAGPLLAAFFLAILYPAVTFSRFGIRAMIFVPLATLAVYCFWRGVNGDWEIERVRWPWFALAGFFLGAAFYTYAAARLLPLLFIMFIPLWFWQDRQALRRYWRSILLMALVALATAVPLIIFFARYPYFFIFRTTYVANKGLGTVDGKPWLTWLGNISRVMMGLFWQGETHLRHNLPGRPYLDPIQFALFLPGLLVSVRQMRQPRYTFLLIWLGVMLLPTILSGDAPHFGRMTGAAPVIAILLAVGADWLWSRLRPRLPGRWLGSMAFLLLAASAIWTGYDYFMGYGRHPQLNEAFYVSDWQMGLFAASQPRETSLYLTQTQEEMATILYALDGRREQLRSYTGSQGLIPAGWPDRPALYLIRPDDTLTLAHLRQFFPEGVVGERHDGFIPFSVPAGTTGPGEYQPVDVVWGEQIRLLGWSEEQHNDQITFTLVWQAERYPERDYTAFVHLTDEKGAVLAQLDRPPAGYPTSDWRPGEIIVDRYVIVLPDALPPGDYFIQTGFYDLPTLERLGDTAVLTRITLPMR